MANTYKDRAIELLRAGFAPIPLDGKRPRHEQWTTMDLSEQVLGQMIDNGAANCNVGIRCTADVHFLDVDVSDQEVAKELAMWLDTELNAGEKFSRRFGQAPKFGIVCTVSGLAKKARSTAYKDKAGNSHHIEVLAQGQQFVAFGIHPATRRPYSWTGPAPGEVGLMDIPTLADDDVTGLLFDKFDELALARGWEETKPTKPNRAPIAMGDDDPFHGLPVPPPDYEVLERAVRLVPASCWDDYEQWVMAGMAIHHATGGSAAGMHLWDSYSRISSKYKDGDEIKSKWKSFRGTAGESLVTFGSLFDLLCDYMDRSEVVRLIHPQNDLSLLSPNADLVTKQANLSPNADLVTKQANLSPGENLVTSASNLSPLVTKNQILSPLVTNLSPTCHQLVTALDTSKNVRDISHGVIKTEVKAYIESHISDVVFSQLCQDVGYKTKSDKNSVTKVLTRMIESGKLKKHPTRRGVYQRVADDIVRMNLNVGDIHPLPIRLPLDLHEHFSLLPGSVIVVGGATNAGKTLLGFNFLRLFLEDLSSKFDLPSRAIKSHHSLRSFTGSGAPENYSQMDPFPMWDKMPGVRFLNSEMSEHELVSNLKGLGPYTELVRDNTDWIKRSYDYPRAIIPNGFNVVDFLQIHKDFFEIGGLIAEMADIIGSGILIILIQKKSGESAPRGGDFALERARVALMLDYAGPGISSCNLRKIKYPKDPRKNPQGMDIDFKIGANLQLEAVSDLRRLTKKQRESVNASYLRDSGYAPAAEDFNGQF